MRATFLNRAAVFILFSFSSWLSSLCAFWDGWWEQRREEACAHSGSHLFSLLAWLWWGDFMEKQDTLCCCFLLLGSALGPCASSYNFVFCEYSNFTISWILLPFVYSSLLFILMQVHADTQLRLKKSSSQYLQIFLRYFHSSNIQTLLLLIKLP